MTEIKMVDSFKLSYQVGTVVWDGTLIRRGDMTAFEKSLDTLQSCGINEVMLSGYTDVEKAEFDMFAETKRIGDILRSRRMKASQHHGLAAMFAKPGTPQDAVVEKLIRSVQYTANLNSDVLVIHPGHVDIHYNTLEEYDRDFHKIEKEIGRKRLMELCAANLDAAGAEAAKLGVNIAIENVHLFDSDITLMRDLLGAVKSPHVGFCLDSGHAHYKCPEVLDWLTAFGDRLFTTHFHDNRGKADEHLPPGFGTIPWIDVILALRRHNYTGTVTFESGGWPGMDEKDGYKAAIQYWRTCEYLAKNP
jgi:sugar phosphate isomerase/epimerase